jgi:tRNA-2-methylthio-N6-dimethylallyladenosine synthase
MEGQIDEAVSKERIMKLIDLQNSNNREQSKAYKDKTVEILCEGYDEKKDMYLGRDLYGRMAYFKGNPCMVGEFLKVKITQTGGISLLGEVVTNN